MSDRSPEDIDAARSPLALGKGPIVLTDAHGRRLHIQDPVDYTSEELEHIRRHHQTFGDSESAILPADGMVLEESQLAQLPTSLPTSLLTARQALESDGQMYHQTVVQQPAQQTYSATRPPVMGVIRCQHLVRRHQRHQRCIDGICKHQCCENSRELQHRAEMSVEGFSMTDRANAVHPDLHPAPVEALHPQLGHSQQAADGFTLRQAAVPAYGPQQTDVQPFTQPFVQLNDIGVQHFCPHITNDRHRPCLENRCGHLCCHDSHQSGHAPPLLGLQQDLGRPQSGQEVMDAPQSRAYGSTASGDNQNRPDSMLSGRAMLSGGPTQDLQHVQHAAPTSPSDSELTDLTEDKDGDAEMGDVQRSPASSIVSNIVVKYRR